MTFGDIELNTILKASCHHYKKSFSLRISSFFVQCTQSSLKLDSPKSVANLIICWLDSILKWIVKTFSKVVNLMNAVLKDTELWFSC